MAGGHPPIHETPEDLEKAVVLYFEGLISTKEDKEILRPPTTAGLAYALGFADRQSLYDQKKRKNGFGEVIASALSKIAEINGRENIPYIQQKKFDYKSSHKDTKKRIMERYHLDASFRLRMCVSSRLSQLIKTKSIKSKVKHLPYTIGELMCHIEKMFIENMTWENYGKWHIDHIIPVSSFDCSDPCSESFQKCWSLSNLRPLWAIDNLKKGNRIQEVLA